MNPRRIRRAVRIGVAGAVLVVLAAGLTARSREPVPAECVVMSAPDESTLFVSDPVECAMATAPASTFKVPHALIALETDVVRDPLALVAWDGAEQPFEAWRRDHSLESAIRSSVVWFFRRTAALIGADRMRGRLAALDYARDTFDGDVTSFWLNGDLLVSPLEQARFMARLIRRDLPVDRAHIEVVAEALRMPAGTITNAAGSFTFTLDWPAPVVVRAKTGYTTVDGEHVSWLVGAVEGNGRTRVFASRVRSREDLPGTAGMELARRVLNERVP